MSRPQQEDTFTLANDTMELMVAALGAEMQSLRCQGTEFLWHGDAAYWSGRAPVLFPIVGPAPGGVIEIGTFSAEMAQHGFARRSVFELVAQDAASCTHRLTPTPQIRAQYPCDFALSVTHRLDDGTLAVVAEVENTGAETLPFGFGFHPAFLWPLPGAEDQPHWVRLENQGEPLLARIRDKRLPEDRLPSPFLDGYLALDPAQFEDDAMIFPEGAGQALTYGAENGPSLRFAFETLPHLALWSKPSGAPFLCVEPWHGMHARTGASAQLGDRPGSLELPPGQTARFAYHVTPTL